MILDKIKDLFAKKLDVKGGDFDEVEEEAILSTLSQDDDFTELLKFWMRRDVNNYFTAPDERTRLIIRGRYLEKNSLIKKIQKLKSEKVEKKEVNTQIGNRYAT